MSARKRPDPMMLAGAEPKVQAYMLAQIVARSSVLMKAFKLLREMDLPQSWMVSGAIYNHVWNTLTARPRMSDVKDIDLFYFDLDLSWDAEDRQIKRLTAMAGDWAGPPLELRNQARVHLWFEEHFGTARAPLTSSRDGIDQFASRTHCVGVRLKPDDTLQIYAPYGLDDIFSFRVTPNPVLPNRETHVRKAARQMAIWPELTIVPWPDDQSANGG